MHTIEKQDIQGFLLRGYGKMRNTRYFLLHITDAPAAKKWLDAVSNDISDGHHQPETTCLNLAITQAGLKQLGLHDENLQDFSREFREGLDTEHRNRLLGDEGASGPKNWAFGAKPENAQNPELADNNIHLMLLAFALNQPMLEEYAKELEKTLAAHGLKILLALDGNLLKDNKIHLGFRDGIGQPAIEGLHMDAGKSNTVATGEFLMGYKNEYGVYPDMPLIHQQQGDMHLLPFDPEGSGKRNLGHNGSYLVYRKMEEKVDLFWSYMNAQTLNADGTVNEEASIMLASKMVGRWPNGAPMSLYPDSQPAGLSDEDDFGYHANDRDGNRCPFGSHIRRNNPRDAFEDNSARQSLKLTKKRRIIRRGRSYGEPLVGTPAHHHAGGEIGLHFMCFNADIADQFEFIQHTWANFPRFQNLYNDPDPITGLRNVGGENPVQNFTVQGRPVNRVYTQLQQFVTIKGGAYFFFPSITAIKYLSTI